MASIKKKSSGGGGGANWMDTYGDMVTLLLCFFVLLYSMSTIDTQKWEWIVQQFNKNYSRGGCTARACGQRQQFRRRCPADHQ